MGGNLLRRKDLIVLLLCCAGACAWAGEVRPAPVSSTPASPTPPGPLALADAVAVPSPEGSGCASQAEGAPGPRASLQGHEGEEIYTLDIPHEEVIDQFLSVLLDRRKDWLQGVLARSIRYRAVIAAVVNERDLPRELRFLPAVESGFQAHAVSPRGAVGLWQLMRNTASPFGLRMDQWVDERRDFMLSTDASLAKLEDNYAQFGDWYLALAAYNCGVGKLSAILARNPGADFWTLRKKRVLPRETAAFVPQFLAIARILSYPGRYGLDVGWEASPSWSRVPLDGCVDLRILSRESGVPLEVLSSSNPELNFPMTPPGSYQYALKVPQEYEQAVRDTLDAATVPLLEFAIHVVKPGDTLSAMAQRYRIPVAMLMQFNPQLSPRALQVGSKIMIPMKPPRSEG